MVDLDKKDREILYALDLDARQSCAGIGKKVGLHRNVVEYRINRLKEVGIIKNFYTIVDTSKLGYLSLRCYLRFQNIDPGIEQKLIAAFVQHKRIFWVSSIDGMYDLSFIILVKDLSEFHSFWQDILKQFHPFIQDQLFSVYVKLYHFPLSYLTNATDVRGMSAIIGGGSSVPVDNIEFRILRVLSADARMPLTEVARRLGTTSMVVNHRIKKLKQLGVIQGFRVNLDYRLLGYKHFKVDVFLMRYDALDDIMGFVTSNPHLVYIDYTAGVSDLELEFHLPDTSDVHRVMREIMVRFPHVIRTYRYFVFSVVHKMRYMPEEL